MFKSIALLFPVFLTLIIAVPAFCEDRDLARLFSDKGISGTIVIADLNGSTRYVCNEPRANTPFVPASTFKILNTLIALDVGAVTEKDVLKWDGRDCGVAACNRDQTLESAFRSSCVGFYQELARRIGTAGYFAYFNKVKFGTGSPTPELTTFWLEGDLKISAIEQIDFLKRIYREELPFRHASYETLKRIMAVERTPEYTLSAKTGWAQRVAPQIGWYVGYVESGDKVWFFAANMDITNPADARFREQVTMEALKTKGII
ncbi:MAG TPA: class D beta-lactamase [Geobacteraceae bacterium]|nr:class D beta-lactamase [Geobacteraceae bacterium]